MPGRVGAEVAALDAYAETVVDLEATRWAAVSQAVAALDHFFASGSACGPTSSEVPAALADLFGDTAVDALGVMATAAAFRAADTSAADNRYRTWAPTDAWIESQRRAWLQRHHPEAIEAFSPIIDPLAAARRIEQIDDILADARADGWMSLAGIESLRTERNTLVADSVVNVDALTDAIGSWSGSDNDPAFDDLVAVRELLIGLLVSGDAAAAARLRTLIHDGVGAGSATATALQEAAVEARITEVMQVEAIDRSQAIAVLQAMDAQIAALIRAGSTPEDAVMAYAIAETVGLDLDAALVHAGATGLGLVDVLGTMAAAEGLDMSFTEFQAYVGFGEFFDVFDNASGGDLDGRVSVEDLLHVVEHPDAFLPAQVLAARAMLDEPILRNRLDTAAGNAELVGGDSFGSREPGDGVISRDDLDAFMTGAYLHGLLAPYAAGIDTAAHGGAADGTVSRNDLEHWLADPANADVPVEVRDGVQFMLDAQLFDQSWWERNRNALAMGAAVLAGGVVIVLTAGTATPLVVTMGAGFVAGGVAAGGTTMAVNHFTGRELDDGALGNALNGGLIGMSVAGLPTAWTNATAITSGMTVRNGVAVTGLTSEVTGIVGGGGIDLLLPDDWEPGIHQVTNTTSLVTGLPGIVYDGTNFAIRRWGTAEPPVLDTAYEQMSLDFDLGESVAEGITIGQDVITPVRVPGNEIDELLDTYAFDGFMNPGPLAGHPRNPLGNFYAGRYSVDVLDQPVVVYRAGAADGTEFGSWYTAEPIESVAQARLDLAVRPEWIDPHTGVLTGSSPVDSVYAIEIPAGTTVYRGPVGTQGGAYMGNPHAEQLFIEETWRIGDVVGRIDIGDSIDLLPGTPTSAGEQLRLFDDVGELGRAAPTAGAGEAGIALAAPVSYAPSNLGWSYDGRVVIEPPETQLVGFGGSIETGHAVNRIIQRGVSPVDILDTLREPAVVLGQSSLAGQRYLYLSETAAVVLDDSGEVVTAWGRGDFNGASERILLEATGGGP